VATAFKPDLLIVDEALSVGDSYFQHKSFDRMRQFRDEGVSIMLVTHSMGDVRTLCDRVILLDKGRVLKDGQPDEVVDYYNALIAEKENANLNVEQRREKNGWLLTKSGTGEARVKKLQLLDAVSGDELAVAQVGQAVELRLEASIHADIPQLVLGYMIRDKQGHVIWGTNTWHTRQVQKDVKSGEILVFRLPFSCTLGPGSYSVSAALTSSDTHLVGNYEWVDNLLVFDVINVNQDFFIGSNWLDAYFSISTVSPR
jgi:lipopolysaccharide transport system ATP-binding protein